MRELTSNFVPALIRTMAALLIAAAIAIATPAYADFQQSQSWFSGLSENQRANLQGNLVLLAQYGGMVDGEFGANTYNALINWQRDVSARPDGVLTGQQIDLLNQMASQVMSDLGMSLVEDLGGHISIMLPTGLLTQQRKSQSGTIYSDASGEFIAETFWRAASEGTLAQHYAEAAAAESGRSVSYSTLRSDLYVVTGRDDDRYFYELVYANGNAVAGFRFTYPEWQRETGGVASVFAASYSVPIAGLATAQSPLDLTQPSIAEVPAGPKFEEPQIVAPAVPAQKSKPAVADANEEGIRRFGNFLVFDGIPGTIGLAGEIGPSTPLDFRRALRAVGEPKVLALGSDGGSVSSALLLAYEVHELGIKTWVPPDLGCYSACSFVFLAGSERLAEGKLGVHQVWGDSVDASSAQTVVSDILEAFSDFGVSQEVTSAMLRTRPEDMYVFSEVELRQWNLNVGGL